jgi:hypothetical protein
MRAGMGAVGSWGAWALPALCLLACGDRRTLEETRLPPSQRNVALESFQPPEALDRIGEWYPHDWRLRLFRALTDTSWEAKVAGLQAADSLHPGEAVTAYHLCLAFLERSRPEEEKRARPYLDRLLARDPDNGVVKVMQAYLLLRENEVAKARTLFMDPRRLPNGDFYFGRLEEMLLGLFSRSGHLNPYTLTEALELQRKVPLPPFEKLIDILYSVFLSPLPDHPYDIRVRGRDAARGLFLLGGKLRVQSYGGPGILSQGYEQRALGFMFQLKAAEFLTLFYRAFDDAAGARKAFDELVAVQREYEQFLEKEPQDSLATQYLDGWSRLIKEHPKLTVEQAVKEAREWRLWRKAMTLKYPKRDD